MRRILLATTAAAVVLTLSGRAFAELDRTQQPPATIAPARTTTSEDLLFNNHPGQATPLTKPVDQRTQSPATAPAPASADQAQPADKAKPVQSEPAQAAPAEPKPTVAAADAPVAGQLKDLVEQKLHQYVPREQDRAGVLAYYRDHNFVPIWVTNGKPTPRQQQAANFLRGVAADGLEPSDYPVPRFDSTDPTKLAADELMMTNSIVTFVRHASIGRVAFSRVSGSVYFDQKAPDPAGVLAKLVDSNNISAALDSYEPQSAAYKALKAELADLRAGHDVEAKPAAKPSKDSKHASKKDHRHTAEAKSEAKFEGKSKDAKIDTIVANMERWRWMPHQLGDAYVVVNIPAFTLKVVKDGKTVWHTKIVDGKPGTHATPLLTETMKYITVNPTWNVPPSIIRNEYLPALAQDPNALARVGLKVGHNSDGSIRIYQPPGDRNALGRIRFNFPNRFLVYQHDTPDKYLFAKETRAYSHGCMRVQNPDDYAEVLLNISQPEDHYTADRIKAMYGSTEKTIKFKNPIPVYLTYQTAFVDDAGKRESRADIYGLDKEITNILHGDRRVADIPVHRNYSSSSKPVMASVRSPRRESSYSQGYSAYGWGSGDDRQGWQGSNSSWQGSGWQSSNRYQPRDRFGIW